MTGRIWENPSKNSQSVAILCIIFWKENSFATQNLFYVSKKSVVWVQDLPNNIKW